MALPITFKTPGVYIDERNAFPNSVVGVETAVPAFIGYTERVSFKGQSLKNKPIHIDSFMEFELFFGKGSKTIYTLAEVVTPAEAPVNFDLQIKDKVFSLIADPNTKFNLYESLKFFYQNGGGSCFIVSVGTYGNGLVIPDFTSTPFIAGIKALEKETEPTMLVIPDAVLLDAKNCYSLQQEMLMHCGIQMNRVAILDIHGGDKGLDDPTYNPIDNFRNGVSSDYFSYGAAYYPWLHTTILQLNEVGFQNLNKASATVIKKICENELSKLNDAQQTLLRQYIDLLGGIPPTTLAQTRAENALAAANALPDDIAPATAKADAITAANKAITRANDLNGILSIPKPSEINRALSLAIPDYKLLIEAILRKENLLPPSAAMAGIYSLVDAQRGVWKAPANVAVSSVVSPAVLIDHKQQEDLNAPISGKAICAIRPFIGLGTMVWGARTLDANSLDWKYINVRRTMIMMEQSIKFAAKAYVFEPNVKNTWVSIQAMISNFLTNLWKLGALAGSVPEDAFSVNVGLGTTMTAIDILDGKMIIEVKVAVSRPAEFIVITFEQQMQKS